MEYEVATKSLLQSTPHMTPQARENQVSWVFWYLASPDIMTRCASSDCKLWTPLRGGPVSVPVYDVRTAYSVCMLSVCMTRTWLSLNTTGVHDIAFALLCPSTKAMASGQVYSPRHFMYLVFVSLSPPGFSFKLWFLWGVNACLFCSYVAVALITI